MRHKEKLMLDPIVAYELAKTINESRLQEAEQARLIRTLKTASTPIISKKRRWRFSIRKMFAGRVNKKDVSTYSSYDHPNI